MVLDFKVNRRLVVGMTINFFCPKDIFEHENSVPTEISVGTLFSCSICHSPKQTKPQIRIFSKINFGFISL